MDIILIVALNIAAIIFFLIELFFFPGITVAAIAGLGCMVYSIYYAFIAVGTTAGYTTWLASGVIALIAIFYFTKWKKIDKYALKANISSTVDREAERSVKVGDEGVSITRLALYGRALINGHSVEVKSTSGLIHEKTNLRVVAVSNAEISVEAIH
jgi:membrane-bound ClpP family serine protease